MKVKINIFGWFLILVLGSGLGTAQTELKVEEVQVIKDFEARLKDFRKVKLEPILPVFDINERQFKYNVSSKPLKLQYEKPSIRPLALPDIEAQAEKNGGFEFGYGIPNAFLGRFYYGRTKEDFTSSIALEHHSANNKNIEHQQYLRNAINFHLGNTLASDVQYDISLFANVDYFNLYGIVANADSTNVFGSPQRRLMNWDLNVGLEKTEITDLLDGSVDLAYNFIHNNIEDIAENDFELNAKVDYYINENLKLVIPAKTAFALNSDLGQFAMIAFNPNFRYQKPFFNLEVGGDFAYHGKTWSIFPDLSFSLNKILGYFDVFGGVAQNAFLNNSYRKIVENPFFRMAGDSILMTSEKAYFTGFRGDIEGAKFEVLAKYNTIGNAQLFVPSFVDPRQFDVVYDTLKDFSIEGSLSYEITRNITLTGKVAKHFYTSSVEKEAWHRPGLEADVVARFSFLENKLIVDGSMFFASGLKFPDPSDSSVKSLPIIFDISGRAEYELFRNFRVFAQWSNITAKQYSRWYQYPSYRIHLIGGFRWLF